MYRRPAPAWALKIWIYRLMGPRAHRSSDWRSRVAAYRRPGHVGRWWSRQARPADMGAFPRSDRVGRWWSRHARPAEMARSASRVASAAGLSAKRPNTTAGWLCSERGGGLIASTSRYAGVAPLRRTPNSRALAQLPRGELRGSSGQATTPAHWRTSRASSLIRRMPTDSAGQEPWRAWAMATAMSSSISSG